MRAATNPAARGFSLLELLVALSIMSMSLGLLYQASTGALRGVGDLDLDQRANLLAQSIIETRDAVPEEGWNESGRAAEMDWRVSSAFYPTTTANDPAIPRLHEVRVVVSWGSGRGPRRIELHTLLPQQRALPGAIRR